MEERSAHLIAIDKAIEYAEQDDFEASVAWSSIARSLVESNRSEVTKYLAEKANAWLLNPSPEGYSELVEAALYYRSFTETQETS